MNSVIGYQPNNIVQGFTVLDETKSAALFDYLSLDSDLHPVEVQSEDLSGFLGTMPPGVERSTTTLRRLEQAFLRRSLLPGAEGMCALCGDLLPVQFLVAAHAKKRAQCTDTERLDIPAIAMPACKFGCDALFEDGYLGVDPAGAILVSPLAPGQGAAAKHLERFHGRMCLAFTHANSEYFRWHRDHTFKA